MRRHRAAYISYSEDTAVDNVSSPKPRTRGGYSKDTQIGLEITAARRAFSLTFLSLSVMLTFDVAPMLTVDSVRVTGLEITGRTHVRLSTHLTSWPYRARQLSNLFHHSERRSRIIRSCQRFVLTERENLGEGQDDPG